MSASAILQRASDAGLLLYVAKSGALGYHGNAAVFASMRAELLANKPAILAVLIAGAANEAETLSPVQNEVKGLAGHAWKRLAESMTFERWADIAELMISADDGHAFLSDWTARNVAEVNIAHGMVSPDQTHEVICRHCGPVFTRRNFCDYPSAQDGTEHGLDCVLSCEWCGRGVPNRRPIVCIAPQIAVYLAAKGYDKSIEFAPGRERIEAANALLETEFDQLS